MIRSLFVALMLAPALVLAVETAPPTEVELARRLDACGTDRRCRIERFRERQDLKRAEIARKTDALQLLDRRRLDELKNDSLPVRDAKRMEADLFLSTSDVIGQGVLVGYGQSAHLRWQAYFTYASVSSYTYTDTDVAPGRGNGSYSNTYGSGYSIGWRAKWLPLDRPLGFYLAGGTEWLGLDMNSYGGVYNDSGGYGGGETSTYEEAEAHCLLGAVGLDYVNRLGFRIGFEIHYLYPFYAQVRDPESGVPRASGRTELERTIGDDAIGAGFSFGWSY